MNWKLEEFHSMHVQFCIMLAKMDFLFLFTSSWQNDGSVIYSSWEKTFLIYTSKRWWMNPSPPLFHWWWILTKWIFLLLLPLLISESKVALFFRNFLPNLHQSIFPLCSYMTRITWLKWEDFEVSTLEGSIPQFPKCIISFVPKKIKNVTFKRRKTRKCS